MKIIKLEVGKKAYIKEIDDTDVLSSMQAEVEGLIAPICFSDGVALIVNDEGLINGSQLNRAVKDEEGNVLTVIGGAGFICGDNGEEFISIQEDKIDKYMKLYMYPQSFYRNGDTIIAQSFEPDEHLIFDEIELY